MASKNANTVANTVANAATNNTQQPFDLNKIFNYAASVKDSVSTNGKIDGKKVSDAVTKIANDNGGDVGKSIVDNINKLTNMIGKGPINDTDDVEFIKKITALYATDKQRGGHDDNYDVYDEILGDNNDSFLINSTNKNKMINNYNQYSMNKKSTSMRGGVGTKSFYDDWNTEDFTLSETDTKKYNRNAKSDHQTGGKSIKRPFVDDDFRTDDFRMSDTESSDNDSINSDTEYDYREDFDSEGNDKPNSRFSMRNFNTGNIFDSSDDIDIDSVSDNYSTVFGQERVRKRNEKADEAYKSFLGKIMDLLGVDEEQARLYRAAIKVNIEENSPELRKRTNEDLKIKEMEKVFENKAKLQAEIKKIDMNKIKEIMKQRKEAWEKRMDEIKKARDEKNSSKNTKKTTKKDPTSTSEKITSDTKAKKQVKKKSVAENGYVISDMDFSSEY